MQTDQTLKLLTYRVAQKNNTETNQNYTDTNDIFGKTLMHNYL